jgi:hypothetical protein
MGLSQVLVDPAYLSNLTRGWMVANSFLNVRFIQIENPICLSGQVKSDQWWSGQNRQSDVARDVILLVHFLLVRQVRFRAPAPWPAFQDVTVV